MLVGILSDTHGYLHPSLPETLTDVDLILHAGDIGSPEVLEALESVAPTRAVWGNIDGQDVRKRVPRTQFLDLDGLSAYMIHIGGRPGRWDTEAEADLNRLRPGLFVCGHSHILRIEREPSRGGMLYLNPGAAGRQGFHKVKTCVLLHVERGKAVRADVVHLDE